MKCVVILFFVAFKTITAQNCRVIIEPINNCDSKDTSQRQGGGTFGHSVNDVKGGPLCQQVKGIKGDNGLNGVNIELRREEKGNVGTKNESRKKGIKGDSALADLFRLIYEIQSNITKIWKTIQSMEKSGVSLDNSSLTLNKSEKSINDSGQSMGNSSQITIDSGRYRNKSGLTMDNSGNSINQFGQLMNDSSFFSSNSYLATPQPQTSKEAPMDGDWTIFQKRFDGSVNFQRNWNNYKNGFGNFKGEFWLGLEQLYIATNQKTCLLRVDLWDFDDSHAYAEYSNFWIENEANLYQLHVGTYSGTAGDSLTGQHSLNNMPFTTVDRDNDRYATRHCSLNAGHGLAGGWWFNQCAYAQLNAEWGRSKGRVHNIFWRAWRGENEALKATEMKYRCVE